MVTALARFYAKAVHRHDTGCVEWVGSTTNGYGRFKVAGKRARAHRWFYEQMIGPIPKHLDLDHLCRNRRCVNLSHLEPVTRSMNLRRSQVFMDGCRARMAELGKARRIHTDLPDGVSYGRFPYKSYRAYASAHGQRFRRSFKTVEEAVLARKEWISSMER